MSGRGKGGKGLGKSKPTISKENALAILFSVLPKKYDSPENHKRLHDHSIAWVEKIFQGSDTDRREVRQEIGERFNTDSLRFVHIEKHRPVFQAAVRRLQRLQKVEKEAREEKKKVVDEIPYVPKYGLAYKQTLHHYETMKNRL